MERLESRRLKSRRSPATGPPLVVKFHQRRQHLLTLSLGIDAGERDLELLPQGVQTATAARPLRRTKCLDVTFPGVTLELCVGTRAGSGRFTGPAVRRQLIGEHR